MANDLDPWAHRSLTRHVRDAQPLDVLHSCPDCPLGFPRPLCPTCLGIGAIPPDRLARWQYEHDQELAGRG